MLRRGKEGREEIQHGRADYYPLVSLHTHLGCFFSGRFGCWKTRYVKQEYDGEAMFHSIHKPDPELRP
jgi:hypothetical protein